MNLTLLAILGFVVLLILILAGGNIGLCMMGIGFLGYMIIRNWNGSITMIKNIVVSNSMTYSMTVIPLFVLMGQFAFYSGISDDLFNSTKTMFGKRKGGLAYASIVSCGLFGAICGSLAATTATMSKVAKPMMQKNGYKDEVIGGTLATAGTLGVLIPPSTPFILYGLTASVSIGSLFAAGILPGILQALLMIFTLVIWGKFDAGICPVGEKTSAIQKLKSLKGFLGMFIIFFIVLGGMFTGILSVTEAAAMGCLVSFIILVARKQLKWSNLKASFLETITTTGMVMLNIVGAGVFGAFITATGLPQNLANWVLEMNLNKWVVIIAIFVIFAIGGCIMDTLALMLLAVPIFLPVLDVFGFNLIWFGVLMVLLMNLGAVTPPVGLSCYISSNVTKIPLTKVFKGAIPFLIALVVTFFIIVFIPQLSLWLPSLL